MKPYLLPFFLLLAFRLPAQVGNSFIGETKMVFQSEDKQGRPFEAFTNYAYMSLSMSNGDFTLNADLSTLHTGDAVLDTLLANAGTQPFHFKGNIDENILKFAQQADDEKMYDMQGMVILNGNSLQCTAQFDPISFSDKSDTKNYRMDFRLTVDAVKCPVKGLESRVTKQFVIEVVGGRLNLSN
ncbi:MAG: hypothetical protein ACXVP0_15695 [Bacteroidia bacterium]